MRATRNGLALLCVVAAMLALVGSVLAAGPMVTVITKDGRRIPGELVTEDAKEVVILVAGIRTALPRAEVREVRYQKTLQQEYQERRAALKADDHDGQYALAKWLYENRAYDLARKELDELQKSNPNHEMATVLRQAIEERLRAEAAKPSPTTQTAVDPVRPASPVGPVTPARGDLPTNLLTAEQINLIKLYEVSLTVKPRVVVPKEVLDTFLTDYTKDLPRELRDKAAQDAFRRKPGCDQLAQIFEVSRTNPGVRSLYPKIEVKEDPPVLRTFRTNIQQRYVISYCATAECHGGPNAGAFFLFREHTEREDVAYTNFYILQNYSTIDAAMAAMVDRERHDKSLLIQYGLRRETAATPHPDVPGFRPGLTGPRDPKALLVIDWIKQLYAPAPKYGVNYTPPKLPSKLPATQPAGT